MSFSEGRPGRVWLPAAAAVVALPVVAVLGCSASTPGPATSAPATSDPAVGEDALTEVLLDGDELTKMLEQPFTAAVGSPVSGGVEEMDSSAPPGECAGVVNLAPKSVYESADVQSYARATWVDPERHDPGYQPLTAKVMFVEEAAVALPSAADARALFTKFAEQWKRCDGQAVNQEPDTPGPDDPPPLAGTEMHVTDVRVTDTVLAASIVLDNDTTLPDTRAIGVQGNFLVEVFIPFTGAKNATGSADPETSSIDAARAMMDKASKLG